jgi:hypothetical protein
VKFKITIQRTEHYEHTFEVSAKTQDAAERKAMCQADEYHFHQAHHCVGDQSITNVQMVPSKRRPRGEGSDSRPDWGSIGEPS